ncbi:MAG: AAA domain-containing protein, partial [Candidatus Thorarchaeota archaeon]|nr:AAA domain-containing protein [Candidatus Thorarchaeota archaeon]
LKAINTPDFAILEGPPGSGKTTVITELIAQLLRSGNRVLLCASTHVAVDNVLEKMQDIDGVFAVRIGLETSVSQEVQKYQVDIRTETAARDIVSRFSKMGNPSISQKLMYEIALRELNVSNRRGKSPFFRLMLESSNLVCGTTIGIISKIDIFKAIQEGRVEPVFDVMILDEASKTPFSEFLVPAVWAKRWIVVGDVKQLSPYVDTDQVVSNVQGLFPNPSNNSLVMDIFHTRGPIGRRGTPLAVITDTADLAIKVGLQCVMTGRTISVLNDEYLALVKERLSVIETDFGKNLEELDNFIVSPHSRNSVDRMISLGCDVILGTEDDFLTNSELVPHDIASVMGDIVDKKVGGKIAWFHDQCISYNRKNRQTWAEEITWRLIRRHDLRLKTNNSLRDALQEDIISMLPVFLPPSVTKSIRIKLHDIEQIALPSIIELLQHGFAVDEPENQFQNAVRKGIPADIFAARHIRLSFQHRMHPDISRFPREEFYDGLSLNDSERIVRDWTFEKQLGEERVLWLNVNYSAKKPSTRNEHEAEAI